MQVIGLFKARAARIDRSTSAASHKNTPTTSEPRQAIPFTEALAALAGYFTPEGQAELQWIVERDFTRELYGPIAPIAEMPPELYERFAPISAFTETEINICQAQVPSFLPTVSRLGKPSSGNDSPF